MTGAKAMSASLDGKRGGIVFRADELVFGGAGVGAGQC